MKSNGPNRALWLAVAASVALVLFRSFVFVWFEQNFDSDQAIVGLMAKHLSEFRALPLFFYGQNYMLGVEAWIAVPFFWLGGPTVTMLRLPLVVINIAVVALVIRLLAANGVAPGLAFVAALPIAACGPIASAQLLTALGASVEPLVYVIVLWLLRNRPAAFGAFFCIASLHREFTVFALPPIILLQWLERREIRWPAIVTSAAAFGAVWIAIDELKLHVNVAGAGGAAAVTGSLAQEAVQVGRLVSFHPSVYVARFHVLVTQGLPDLFGARPLPIAAGGIWGDSTIGSRAAGAALATAVLFAAVRAIAICVRDRPRGLQFPIFLGLVALEAVAAYPLHGGTAIEPRTELNYVLLALFLPVAVLGVHFSLEKNRACLSIVAALVAIWTLAMTADNARVNHEYAVRPPRNIHRALADFLTSHRIKYAWGGYWDAYRVTFLSRERVIVASTETVRIPAYQTRVERNEANAARILRQPCDEGTPVVEWCVVDPLHR